MKHIKRLFILIIVPILFVSGCSKKNKEPLQGSELSLGTLCKVIIYDKYDEKILSKVFEEIRRIDDLMNVNKEESEISQINKNAGKSFVKVSDDVYKVIRTGVNYGEISRGKFDITIGPLVKLWNIGTEGAKLPGKSEIDEKLKGIDYKKIKFKDETKEVILEETGMAIDLGGIAKGFAADRVVEILRENGVESALVDLGGNVFVVGTRLDGEMFNIGIQNPIDSRWSSFATIKIKDKTLVTSGIYERFFEAEGKSYHHILDTETGYPVENNLAAVTIVSNNSMISDALSTSIFALGLDEGMKLIESLNDVDAIFVTKDSDVYITSGIKDQVKIVDDRFKLCD